MSKILSVRVPDALFEELTAEAGDRQMTVTAVVVNALWGRKVPAPIEVVKAAYKRLPKVNRPSKEDVAAIMADAVAQASKRTGIHIGPIKHAPGSLLKKR